MSIQLFVNKDLAIHSYLIQDDATKECVVIDPPRVIHEIKRYIDLNKLKLKAIVETHVHADFISGAVELRHAFKGLPLVYCSAAGGNEWIPHYADCEVKDGDKIVFGSKMLKARHTPGHTPEHITWLYFDLNTSDSIPIAAFTGDFLFIEGVGRPDLLGDDKTEGLLKDIHKSLFTRIADLPDEVEIYPAHGPGSFCSKVTSGRSKSTLGEERKLNPALQPIENMNTWVNGMMCDLPAVPPSFSRNKKKNVAGIPLMSELPMGSFHPEYEDLKNFAKFDFRDPEAFGKEHLPGSINVPLGPSVGNWLAAVLPQSMPILCILPDDKEKQRVLELIRLLGCDQTVDYTLWDHVKHLGSPTSLEAISSEALNAMIDKKADDIFVADVRTPMEWKAGHIKQAHHVELSQLQNQVSSIPRDKKIVALCGSGWRSSIAASWLQSQGYKNVSHLAGGMKSWSMAGFPMDKESM